MPFSGLEQLDSATASEAGEWLHLRSPINGEPLFREGQALRLKLAGPDSDVRQAALDEIGRRQVRAAQLAPENKLPPREARRIEAEEFSATVLAWEGFLEQYSRANVTRLFLEYRWTFEQADAFSRSRANFLRPTAAPGPTLSVAA